MLKGHLPSVILTKYTSIRRLMHLAFPTAQTLAEAFAPCLSPARADEAVKKFDPAFSTAWLRYRGTSLLRTSSPP